MSRADYESLLNEGLKTATSALQRGKHFYPFAISLSEQGDLAHLESDLIDTDPNPDRILRALQAGLRRRAEEGRTRATAIITDVHVGADTGKPQDAVRVTVEHRTEQPVQFLMPYKFEANQLKYGQLFTTRADRCVFP